MSAKVSIGVPVYNAAQYLDLALGDLLAQTYEDIEIIISDNASTDGTWEICQRRAAADPRIRLHRQPTNIGMIANFAFVLNEARGEFFFWAAFDDRRSPEFAEELLSALTRKPDAVVAMSQFDRIDEQGRVLNRETYRGLERAGRDGGIAQALRLASGSQEHIFLYGLFRRALLQRAFASYPAALRSSDRVFMTCVALAGPLAAVPKPLFQKRVTLVHAAKRYANEEFGKVMRDRLGLVKTCLQLGPAIRAADYIPENRKRAWPLVSLVFTGHVLMAMLSQLRRTLRLGTPRTMRFQKIR